MSYCSLEGTQAFGGCDVFYLPTKNLGTRLIISRVITDDVGVLGSFPSTVGYFTVIHK